MLSLKYLSVTVLLAIIFPLCVKAQEFHKFKVYSACDGSTVDIIDGDTGAILEPTKIGLKSPDGIQYSYSAFYNFTFPVRNFNARLNKKGENNPMSTVHNPYFYYPDNSSGATAKINFWSQNGNVSSARLDIDYGTEPFITDLSALIEFNAKTRHDGCRSCVYTPQGSSKDSDLGCSGINNITCFNPQIQNIGMNFIFYN